MEAEPRHAGMRQQQRRHASQDAKSRQPIGSGNGHKGKTGGKEAKVPEIEEV